MACNTIFSDDERRAVGADASVDVALCLPAVIAAAVGNSTTLSAAGCDLVAEVGTCHLLIALLGASGSFWFRIPVAPAFPAFRPPG